MDVVDYRELLPFIKETSNAILEIYYKSSQFTVQSKSDATPLTQADLIAHELITAGLNKITPNIPVLSEEGPEISFDIRQQWQQYWLIDPLDGTKEFVRHSGDFVINIALIRQQKPIFGLIYSPVLNEFYFATLGKGAFKQTAEMTTTPLRIHVRPWAKKLVVMVGHYYKVEKLKKIVETFGEYEILSMGSALKFCMIAEGKADLYPRVGSTSEWDTAAGQIIVEEAGGVVVDFALQPLCYNTKPSLLNPYFFVVGDRRLLQELEKVI